MMAAMVATIRISVHTGKTPPMFIKPTAWLSEHVCPSLP